MKPKMRFWMGSTPDKCDNCGQEIGAQFVDGKTVMGPWGMLCVACHKTIGVGLGLGKGQLYEYQKSGDWLKIKG